MAVRYTNREPVVSSNLVAAGWREGFKPSNPSLMEIVFHGGRVYLYFEVPEAVYDALMAAPSKGKYFHQHIKKGTPYRYRRLE